VKIAFHSSRGRTCCFFYNFCKADCGHYVTVAVRFRALTEAELLYPEEPRSYESDTRQVPLIRTENRYPSLGGMG